MQNASGAYWLNRYLIILWSARPFYGMPEDYDFGMTIAPFSYAVKNLPIFDTFERLKWMSL